MKRSAKSTVVKTLLEHYPAVVNRNLSPATECIVEQAGPRDVRELAGDAVTGVSVETLAVVKALIQRPEVMQCLSAANLAAVLSA